MCFGDGETYERYAIERWFQERQALLDEAQAELESAGPALGSHRTSQLPLSYASVRSAN